jgi:multidrug efflux pump
MLGWFTRSYGRLLRPSVHFASALARPFVGWPFGLRLGVGLAFAVGIAAAIGLPNVLLYNQLEGEFLPEEDKGRFFCFIFTPEGSTIEYTDRQAAKMEAMLAKTPEVDGYGSVTAFAQAGPGQVNQGIVFRAASRTLRNAHGTSNKSSTGPAALRQQFFEGVEGAIAVPNIPKAIGRSFGSAFQLVIQAQDLDQLSAYTDSLLNKLRTMPTLVNVRSSFEVTKPELRLGIDRSAPPRWA